jgi:hypothetical protein
VTRPATLMVLGLAVGWSGAGLADPPCRGVAALKPGHPRTQIASRELGVSVADRTLSVWPLGTAKLNPEAGVAVTFVGGRSCVSTFTDAGRDGIRLDADAPVAAVEAAVCESGGGLCIPIRVEMQP